MEAMLIDDLYYDGVWVDYMVRREGIWSSI